MRGRRSYNRSISNKRSRQTPRIKHVSKASAFPTGASPKPQKLSDEAQEILRTRVGYRTEVAYGEGYRDAKAVLEHETKELGNTAERGEAASRLGLPRNSTLKQIGEEIDRRFGPDAKVLWLATREGVKYYLENDEGKVEKGQSVDQYTIPSGALLLTDLGYDGQLFLVSDDDYRQMEESSKSVKIT